MFWDIAEYVTYLSWIYALYVLIRRRREILQTVRSIPVWARVFVGALLIVCAFIPGPVDDVIVVALISRLGSKRG